MVDTFVPVNWKTVFIESIVCSVAIHVDEMGKYFCLDKLNISKLVTW